MRKSIIFNNRCFRPKLSYLLPDLLQSPRLQLQGISQIVRTEIRSNRYVGSLYLQTRYLYLQPVSTASSQESQRRDQVFVSNGKFNITMATSDGKFGCPAGRESHEQPAGVTKSKTNSNETPRDELDESKSGKKEKKLSKHSKENDKSLNDIKSAK